LAGHGGYLKPAVKLPWREDPFVIYLLVVVLPLALLVLSIVAGLWWTPS
jgi:hypothetical protein